MTESIQIREFMVLLQSCTVSLPVLQRSCSETSITCIDAYDAISVKGEEDRDIDCQEDNSVAITFPTIKCEQDEVSYCSVCPLLAELCQYQEIFTALYHLHISVDLST